MSMRSAATLALLLAVLAGAHTPARAANPVITTLYSADPSGHVFGDRLYLYASHDRNDAREWDMTDYHVYSTGDLANWRDHGVALDLKDVPWAQSHLWAPDAAYRDGKYFLFFPARQKIPPHASAIGIAIGDDPAGPFVPAPLPIPGARGIDPAVFIDHDGQAYLFWAGRGLEAARLSHDLRTLAEPPRTLEGFPNFFEGPWLFKRAGRYYMTFPAKMPGGSGDGGQGQFFDYSVADHPLGPYTPMGHFTRTQPGAGNIHGSQLEWHGRWLCFYHDFSTSAGRDHPGFKRSIRLDELRFNPDGSLQPLVWTDAGPAPLKPLDPYVRHEAEELAATDLPEGPHAVAPVANGECGVAIGHVGCGAWIKYANVDFGRGAAGFSARIATPGSDSLIRLRLDSITGPLVGTLKVPATGGWLDWQTATTTVDARAAAGVHSLFLIFDGPPTGGLLNLDWFFFTPRKP